MAKPKKKKEAKAKAAKLYTLTEVSTVAGISMPTLQRYKKSYQDRIPSVGEGRSQRYPEKAIKAFQEIKKENMAKRGRPRKAASAKPGKPVARARKTTRKKATTGAKKKAAAAAPLMSLAEIERITGISYPTLLRYVKINLARIPHVGEGRKRRYQEEAVAVFREMRAQSSRGGRKIVKAGERAASATRSAVSAAVGKTARAASSDLGKRIKELESTQARMAKQLKELLDEVRKPIEVTLKRR